MSALTAVTLCSGGGGAAVGLRAAGMRLVGAVEYDAAIAAQYAANLGDHVLVARLQDVDFRQWVGVDVLQDSNPCPNFSNAKQGGQETPNDLAIADATGRAIHTIRPRVFWLENVEGYARSESYRRIRAALDDLDYWSHATVVNAADYGVPQTRRRLILRAVAGGWMQPFRPLPAPVPWVGWYAAITDLLDRLPASEFADWQLRRLPEWLTQSVMVGMQGAGGDLMRCLTEPAPTITIAHGAAKYRAFLMREDNTQQEWGRGYRLDIEPSVAVASNGKLPRAFLASPVDGLIGLAHQPAQTVVSSNKTIAPRAWLEQGRVVKMTPHALARFQSFPDTYQLPANNALACRIIGNAVPPLLSQRITESLIERSAA